MIVGIPREIKDNENRVAATPAGVYTLVQDGQEVVVEAGAGVGSSISDQEYEQAGAVVVPTAAEVFARAEMIVKVKEPLEPEFALLRRDQVLFTYLHLASSTSLTRAMVDIGLTGVAYETIQTADGQLPLLMPMSEVAGKLATQMGAWCLEKHQGGRGVLLGGVPGVPPAEVVVIGCGSVGLSAVKIAAGMGAHVTVMDVNHGRLKYLDDVMKGTVTTLYSNPYSVAKAASWADLMVGAVLIPGARAPKVVSEAAVKGMKPGSVVVDVAVDQGGCMETTRPTTHSDPTYVVHDVVHYAVTNMPAAVPRTSTFALTNSTLPYIRTIARVGLDAAMAADPALALGLNVRDGELIHAGVREAYPDMVAAS